MRSHLLSRPFNRQRNFIINPYAYGGGDPYAANVVSHLHFDGSNGSTVFTDVCGNIWYPYGTDQISTTQSKFGGASFKPNLAITTPAASGWKVGAGDFTIEFWLYLTTFANSLGNQQQLFGQWDSNTGYYPYYIYVQTDGKLRFLASKGTANDIALGTAVQLSTGQWYACAFTRYGNLFSIWLDGVSVDSATLSGGGSILNTVNNNVFIGGTDANATLGADAAYIDEFRFTNGACRHTTTYTPSTTALSDTGEPYTNFSDADYSSVVLLLHADRIQGSTTALKDFSPSPRTVAALGAGSLQTAVTKFAPHAWSGSISTTTAPISVTSNALLNLTGDFTIECWCRWGLTNTTNFSPVFAAKRNSVTQLEYYFAYFNGNLYFAGSTNGTSMTTVTVAWTPSTGQWYHIAVSRSGSTVRFFVDGTQVGTNQTVSGTLWSDTRALTLLTDSVNTCVFNGYLDDVRITKGLARYTANFTPDTVAFPNG